MQVAVWIEVWPASLFLSVYIYAVLNKYINVCMLSPILCVGPAITWLPLHLSTASVATGI